MDSAHSTHCSLVNQTASSPPFLYTDVRYATYKMAGGRVGSGLRDYTHCTTQRTTCAAHVCSTAFTQHACFGGDLRTISACTWPWDSALISLCTSHYTPLTNLDVRVEWSTEFYSEVSIALWCAVLSGSRTQSEGNGSLVVNTLIILLKYIHTA